MPQAPRLTQTILTALLLCGSTAAMASSYDELNVGQLKGKVLVQWLEPDVFLFIPDRDSPLTFVRSNGTAIAPGRMLTDGGSVPRPMWAFRSYSPWGYAPAFIIHDWLFHINQCKIENYFDFDLQTAGTIMGEAMKTLMESESAEKDPFTVEVMVSAVTSIFAQQAWNSGPCIPAPASFNVVPLMEYTLSFD